MIKAICALGDFYKKIILQSELKVINEEIKLKSGKIIYAASLRGRTYGALKLIELAKKSVSIYVSTKDFGEARLYRDSKIISAMRTAAERGIKVVLDTSCVSQSFMRVDGKIKKIVYNYDGKTIFRFY